MVDEAMNGVTTYYQNSSRTLSTAPIKVEEGSDIIKLSKLIDNDVYTMMF